MRRAPALLLVLAACNVAPDLPVDAGPRDAGEPADAGATCAPPALCFAGCAATDTSCVRGILDTTDCVCRGDEGQVLAWPDPDAIAELLSIELDPPLSTRLPEGQDVALTVVAHFLGAADRDVTALATVSSTPENALELVAGHWRPNRRGDLSIRVAFESGGVTREATASTRVVVSEARAVWVTRYSYSTAADVNRIIDAAADARFNVVLFQVRGFADAYYRSTLEPWAKRLAGLGVDPGFDPLATAIETAHARGIELHAYVNAFTAWPAGDVPASAAGAPDHVLRAHPEWLEKTATGLTIADNHQWLAPGIPAVRAWNVAVVREILERYEVDGIHLDRIRYGDAAAGFNALEREAFAAQYGTDETKFRQFRTDAVNEQVRQIYELIAEVRPAARLSAAVWGIHTKLPGCGTSQGVNFFQDSLAWTEGGYIDALCPMIYWSEGTGCTDYGDLLATFLLRRADRQIWAGMNVLSEKPDRSCNNCVYDRAALATRISVARSQQAAGVTLFASAYLDDHDVWDDLASAPFVEEAVPPPK